MLTAILLFTATSAAGPPAPGSYWSVEIALQASEKLGGCAVGDLDPSRPGNEIVAACRSGEIFLVYRERARMRVCDRRVGRLSEKRATRRAPPRPTRERFGPLEG